MKVHLLCNNLFQQQKRSIWTIFMWTTFSMRFSLWDSWKIKSLILSCPDHGILTQMTKFIQSKTHQTEIRNIYKKFGYHSLQNSNQEYFCITKAISHHTMNQRLRLSISSFEQLFDIVFRTFTGTKQNPTSNRSAQNE